ncbi:unnamed protein product [Natator depressus]
MAFEHIPQKDWYKILGAEPSESLTELKQKYQKLVLLYHPDKQSADVPAGEVEERVQRFIEIDQAWKILGNEETKKEYDLQRRGLINLSDEPASVFLDPTVETMDLQNPFTSCCQKNAIEHKVMGPVLLKI